MDFRTQVFYRTFNPLPAIDNKVIPFELPRTTNTQKYLFDRIVQLPFYTLIQKNNFSEMSIEQLEAMLENLTMNEKGARISRRSG